MAKTQKIAIITSTQAFNKILTWSQEDGFELEHDVHRRHRLRRRLHGPHLPGVDFTNLSFGRKKVFGQSLILEFWRNLSFHYKNLFLRFQGLITQIIS
jgi:hypothetical protein